MDKIKDIIPIDKVYEDALRPSIKEVGDILKNTTKTARFLFMPFDWLATLQDRFQKYLERIGEKVEDENLVNAPPRTVTEVFEKLRYLPPDSILTELFLNLLATSIDKTKQSKSHPAFPTIISQLAPYEAVILFYLNKQTFELKEYMNLDIQKNIFTNKKIIYNKLLDKFKSDQLDIDEENIYIYIEHLTSLNIISAMQKGNQVPIFDDIGTQTGLEIYYNIELTVFGKLFTSLVIPNNIESFSDIKTK